jgi:hypothetical protein
MISYYCASQGLGQAEIDSMNFLETEVMELQNIFKPLVNGNNEKADDASPGAPTKDDTELTETGEQTREDGSDWR